jgi:hypothetical protein
MIHDNALVGEVVYTKQCQEAFDDFALQPPGKSWGSVQMGTYNTLPLSLARLSLITYS